jgi:hypothetical protein
VINEVCKLERMEVEEKKKVEGHLLLVYNWKVLAMA